MPKQNISKKQVEDEIEQIEKEKNSDSNEIVEEKKKLKLKKSKRILIKRKNPINDEIENISSKNNTLFNQSESEPKEEKDCANTTQPDQDSKKSESINDKSLNFEKVFTEKSSSYENSKSLSKTIPCEKEDIFCLCKDHPNPLKCVCAAYPFAEICSEDYCNDENNKDKYECNPKEQCSTAVSLIEEKCSCRKEFSSVCKCKINPLKKECFCAKYDKSHMCNDNNCSFERGSIFCKCSESASKDKECEDNFCMENSSNPKCECISDPMKGYCKCLNNPQENCSKKEIMNSLSKYKSSITSQKDNQSNITNLNSSNQKQNDYIKKLFNKQLLFNSKMKNKMREK